MRKGSGLHGVYQKGKNIPYFYAYLANTQSGKMSPEKVHRLLAEIIYQAFSQIS